LALETRYRTIDAGGLEIFYREAGPAAAPVVLLLHGFPTSSRMFRNLIPMLADKYRVIAPDYPAFGHSAAPSRSDFHYTHAHLSEVVEALIGKLRVTRFAMYVMDFAGPIGYRLMLKNPDHVTGVVVQNTQAFGEPIDGPLWATELAYWKDGSSAHRDAVRSKLTPDAVRNQYVAGTREPSLIDPDNWTIDSALLARPGVDEIMLDLLYDIRNNRQSCACSAKFAREDAMRFRRQATCCSTSARSAWICVLSWQRKSWRVSEMLFRRWTKFMASAILTTVISWVSSMGPRIPGVRRRSTPWWSARKTPRSPAAVT
jgi:pimeloyl-ACP methyl ester carboxylesterase